MTLVGGLGLGCEYASLAIATQAPQTEENQAITSGLTPFFRAIGQAIGIAVSDAIYQNRLRSYLLNASSGHLNIKADELAKNSASITVVLALLPEGSRDRIELLHAFNKSLHAIWWTMMGISLLGGMLSLLMKEMSMDKGVRNASGSGFRNTEAEVKREERDYQGGDANRIFNGSVA